MPANHIDEAEQDNDFLKHDGFPRLFCNSGASYIASMNAIHSNYELCSLILRNVVGTIPNMIQSSGTCHRYLNTYDPTLPSHI